MIEPQGEQDPRLAGLLREAAARRWSRREIVRRGAALGLAAPTLAAAIGRGRGAAAAAQEASPAAVPGTAGPVMVPILNRELTFDEIKAEIENEGEVTVGNWTYTANDTLVRKFEEHVQEVYGVEVRLNYQASQQPSTYLTNLYTALQAGDPAPYDVLAIEENYWAEARSQPESVMEEFLPSGLIPNADRVLDIFKHSPTAIGFQASATPGIVYNSANADFLQDWPDLADERLRGKILMWLPGDITSGGFLLGLAAALGKDYQDQAQMREVIDFAVDEIGPNVLKYTTDFSEAQQLFGSGVVDVVTFWNSLARLQYLSGQEEAAFLVAASGQYAANGYLWIPKGPRHPVLAQVFVDWRLSDDAQLPGEDWGIEHAAWAELHEGLMGPSYEPLIPEWFREDYYTYYPTIEQLETQYRTVDWDYYTANSGEWFDYYEQRLGL